MGNHPTLFEKFNTNKFKQGSVVVITGASSGMGKELCLRYAARGCKVVIGARRLPELNEIKNECLLRHENPNVLAV